MKWNYLFKHWFGTIALGPVISEMIPYISGDSHLIVGLCEVYPIAFLFSLFFSAPTYLLYGFIYYYLAQKRINGIYAKAILISFAVTGVIVTTSIIHGSLMLNIALSYSIASIITGCLFKLNFNTP